MRAPKYAEITQNGQSTVWGEDTYVWTRLSINFVRMHREVADSVNFDTDYLIRNSCKSLNYAAAIIKIAN